VTDDRAFCGEEDGDAMLDILHANVGFRALRMARISPEDLKQMIDDGKETMIVDLPGDGGRRGAIVHDPRRAPDQP
jgi:hypothetical protein